MKSTMKKALSLILALVMSLALVACGGGGAGGASTGNAGGDAAGGEPMEIKIATIHHEGSVGVRCLQAMEEYLETETEGRIQVTIYAGGVLGDWTTALDMLYENDVQFDVVNPVAFENQVPALSLLNNYYTFDSLEHVHKFFEGEGGDFIMDSWNQIGLQGMELMSLGFRQLYNSARPIETMDDLKDLKIRGYSPIQIGAWQAVGVDPVSVDWNELFVSLQQKLIDGEEGATVNFSDYSFYEVQPYFTKTEHVFSTDMLITNQEWYEGLSETDRALIDEGTKICYEYHRDNYIPENEALMEKFASEYGTKINELDPAVKAEMAEKMSAATEKMIVETTGQEMYDEFMAMVDAARP